MKDVKNLQPPVIGGLQIIITLMGGEDCRVLSSQPSIPRPRPLHDLDFFNFEKSG